jgi:DNA-binding response OmpR family regulator
MRILLVEDVLPYAEFLAASLETAGARPLIATDRETAIEALRTSLSLEDPPDAAVIDLGLPGPDGISVASELARLQPGLRIILTSANDCDPNFRAPSFAGFLKKPFPPDDLIEMLHAEPATCPDSRALRFQEPGASRTFQARYKGLLRVEYAAASDAVARLDYGKLKTIAHRLKGSAPHFDFPHLAHAANLLDEALKLPKPPGSEIGGRCRDFLIALEEASRA